MADELLNPPRRVRGQPFAKGRSGNPAGRRRGSRNRATLAAAVLLEGESEALTRKAVELALAGDPVALRLCIERILPVCRERRRQARPAGDRGCQRRLCGGERRHLGAGARLSDAKRGRADCNCGRDVRPSDRYNQKERVSCKSPADSRIEPF